MEHNSPLEDSSEESNGEDAAVLSSDLKQLAFVEYLEKNPILLDKSQTPAVKVKKTTAAKNVIPKYAKLTGEVLTEKTLQKKISNMKTALKTKTDRNATGNKKIVLSDWEKRLLHLLKPSTNPVYSRIPGAASAGVKRSHATLEGSQLSPVLSPTIELALALPGSISGAAQRDTSSSIPPPPEPKRRKMSIVDKAETEDTKDISNTQLNRLVLLKQLELVNLKIFKHKLNSGASED